MHTIALLPLVSLSFIAIAFTEHCKKALLQCTSGTESAEKAKEKKKKINKNKTCFAALRCETAKKRTKKKTLRKTKPVSLRFAAKQLIKSR